MSAGVIGSPPASLKTSQKSPTSQSNWDRSSRGRLVGRLGHHPASMKRSRRLRVLAMPEVAEKLRAQGQEVAPLGPEEFGPFLRAEINTWADVVRQAGLKFE